MVLGVLWTGVNSWGRKLASHLYIVLRLKMCGAIPLLPLCTSWHAPEYLDFYVSSIKLIVSLQLIVSTSLEVSWAWVTASLTFFFMIFVVTTALLPLWKYVIVPSADTGIALLLALNSVKEIVWCNWDAESNVRAHFGCRWGILCVLYRLAEGIWPCKLDQINADPKSNWYWLVWKKLDQ